MPDDPELIEKYEAELQNLLTKMHNDGLGTEVIIFLLKQRIDALELREKAQAV